MGSYENREEKNYRAIFRQGENFKRQRKSDFHFWANKLALGLGRLIGVDGLETSPFSAN